MDNHINIFSEITPDIIRLAKMSETADQIDPELFTKYEVKRGLRDLFVICFVDGLLLIYFFVST